MSLQKLKKIIQREYKENKQDRNYTEAKQEFQYLHEKLAHIKKLVHSYDVKNANGMNNT